MKSFLFKCGSNDETGDLSDSYMVVGIDEIRSALETIQECDDLPLPGGISYIAFGANIDVFEPLNDMVDELAKCKGVALDDLGQEILLSEADWKDILWNNAPDNLDPVSIFNSELKVFLNGECFWSGDCENCSTTVTTYMINRKHLQTLLDAAGG